MINGRRGGGTNKLIEQINICPKSTNKRELGGWGGERNSIMGGKMQSYYCSMQKKTLIRKRYVEKAIRQGILYQGEEKGGGEDCIRKKKLRLESNMTN